MADARQGGAIDTRADVAYWRAKPMVYIAGPYTQGDRSQNVRDAVAWMVKLMDMMLTPVCPHLSHLADLMHPLPWEKWMRLDYGLVVRCDAIVRLPGPSTGADKEMTLARAAGLKVFEATSSKPEGAVLDDIMRWHAERMARIAGTTEIRMTGRPAQTLTNLVVDVDGARGA